MCNAYTYIYRYIHTQRRHLDGCDEYYHIIIMIKYCRFTVTRTRPINSPDMVSPSLPVYQWLLHMYHLIILPRYVTMLRVEALSSPYLISVLKLAPIRYALFWNKLIEKLISNLVEIWPINQIRPTSVVGMLHFFSQRPLWRIHHYNFLWGPSWENYYLSLNIHLVTILKIFSITSNIISKIKFKATQLHAYSTALFSCKVVGSEKSHVK